MTIKYISKKIKNSNSLKIIFSGTPQFAEKHLNALLHSNHHVIAVFTQPDRPSGRGKKIIFSPVKMLAKKKFIPLFQPTSLHSKSVQNKIISFNADIMVVVAYGLIIPKDVLDLFPMGCINVHASLLPRWRGPSPIQWAILMGEKITGVTTIYMDEGIDTGSILHSSSCLIDDKETSESLYEKLSFLGIKTMLLTLEKILKNKINKKNQNHKLATYSKMIYKKNARLNWVLKACELERSIRAFNPWPISYFILKNKNIKVWNANILKNANQKNINPGTIITTNKNGIQISTGYGILNINELQFPSSKKITAHDLLNSKKNWFKIGNKLE